MMLIWYSLKYLQKIIFNLKYPFTILIIKHNNVLKIAKTHENSPAPYVADRNNIKTALNTKLN